MTEINHIGYSGLYDKSIQNIGFRLQFFCTKCNRVLSPKNLDERGCPKCSRKLDLSLR